MTIIKQYNTDTSQWEAIAVGQKGDTGEGVAAGGTTDQILTKASNTDFDTQWVSSISIDTATLDKAIWNIPATPYPDALAGELQWNLDLGTLDLGLDGNVVLPIGQASFYYVKNQTGSSIAKGTLVMAVGTLGDSGRILAAPWDGNSPPQTIMGITNEPIEDGGDGYVVHFGEIRQINATGTPYTETWQDFDILYAGPNGGITNIPPQAPETKTIVALVVHAVENGAIFVRPTFSPSIANDDLVEITNIADNDILRYNSANNRFENESLGSIADQDSDSVSITGGSVTGITDLAVADGGTGASDAATARTNLELGTISTQDANTVDIDGGNIDGTAIGVSATSSGSFTTIDGSGDMNIDSGTLFVDVSENRVGINTTSPNRTFVVNDSSNFSLLQIANSTTGSGEFDGFQLSIGNNDALINNREAASLAFRTSNSEAMRIDSSGNVGIGTTSPGDFGALGIRKGISVDSGTTSLTGVSFSASDAANSTFYMSHTSGLVNLISNTSMSFWTRIGVTSNVTERMRIDSSGNVGIGTTSPVGKLRLSGSSVNGFPNSGANLWLTDTNATSGEQDWAIISEESSYKVITGNGEPWSSGHIAYGVGRSGTSVGEHIWYTGLSSEKMRLTSSGNVGIGTDNPTFKLDVNGNTRVTGTLQTSDLVLSNESYNGNSIDGTKGKWLIQEGEDDLFIINVKNGKKYKFNLVEVE